MNEHTLIHRLSRHHPKTVQGVLDCCGFPLQWIGSGTFRDAYHVTGTSLVIKVPRFDSDKATLKYNIQHARDEFSIWRRMKVAKLKYAAFKSYLPELIYFDTKTGIMVVRKYNKVRYSKIANKLIRELEASITATMKTAEADIHYGNLGLDKDGNIKIIDMGLFIRGKI